MAVRDVKSQREVRHDLRFSEAGCFGSYISIKDVRNEPLHQPWYTFQHNIESLRLMVGLPNSIIDAAVEHLIPLTQAIFNVLGKPVLEDSEVDEHKVAISEEYRRVSHGFFGTKRHVQSTFILDLWHHAIREVSSSPLTNGGLFSLLEAQIIGVWTAFNTLTTDLVIAAVNSSPNTLYNIGKKQVELATLLKSGGDHNWSGRMGELARLYLRLDSFTGTKEGYSLLIKNDEINEILSRPQVEVASLVRNQCIHDNCIATDIFIDKAKSLNAQPWASLVTGQLLPLNGRDIGNLSEGVIICANDLVRALDRWLGPPAEQAPKQPDQDQ